MLKQEQIEFLKKLSQEDRLILASIIKDAKIEDDYTGMNEDGGSYLEESASETLRMLAYKIVNFDEADIHWC